MKIKSRQWSNNPHPSIKCKMKEMIEPPNMHFKTNNPIKIIENKSDVGFFYWTLKMCLDWKKIR